MNRTLIKIKLSILSFLLIGGLTAQNRLTKMSQSIKVDKDVTIDLNTSYTNIVFDTWNKNTVEIEAYIEAEDLSEDALENALKSWDIDVDASFDHIKLSTNASRFVTSTPHAWTYTYSTDDSDVVEDIIEELKFELADLPEIAYRYHYEMPEFPELPKLPEIPRGVGEIAFDYKAYERDGEKYLEQYAKEFESAFGKEYAEKMEKWSEKFEKEWGETLEDIAKRSEGNAKKVEILVKRKEALAEKERAYAEKLKEKREKVQEAWAMRHEKIAEARKERAEKREKLLAKRRISIGKLVDRSPKSKVKKTIKIKMPKGAKLKVNVRHGELEFASNIDNLKADLSHTKFTANSINGSSTSINDSYSTIHVTHWNLGELHLKYVEETDLVNVKNMILTSNSSNVNIANLTGSAIIDGNIGDIKILNVADTFSNLNLILQNNDTVIVLPKTPHSLNYKGSYSRFSHPQKVSKENVSSFANNNLESRKTIVINAKYSHVEMK